VQENSTASELLRCWKLFSFYFSRSIPLNCIYLHAPYIRTKTTTGVYNRRQIYSFAVKKQNSLSYSRMFNSRWPDIIMNGNCKMRCTWKQQTQCHQSLPCGPGWRAHAFYLGPVDVFADFMFKRKRRRDRTRSTYWVTAILVEANRVRAQFFRIRLRSAHPTWSPTPLIFLFAVD